MARIVAELESVLGPVTPRLRARLDPELLNGPEQEVFQSVAHSVGGIAEEREDVRPRLAQGRRGERQRH